MSLRKNIIIVLFAGILLGLSGGAFAASENDPIIRMNSNTKLEVDLGMIVADLMPLLIEGLAEEDEESAAMMSFLLEKVGLDALDLMKMESKQTKDRSTSKTTITLDPDKKDRLLHRLYTVDNGKCNFGDKVQKNDLVMFMTLHNFSAYLDIILDFVASHEMSEIFGDLPIDEFGDLNLGGFSPRQELVPLLSGELDFFVLASPEGEAVSPLNAPYFLVLGSPNGFALRDKILEVATFLGGEAGAGIATMIESMEPEQVGDFELVEFPFGGAMAVSQDYLVLTMAPTPLRTMLTGGKGGLKVPNGIEWVYMNGSKYGQYMESVMDMTAGYSDEDSFETALMMKAYAVLFDHVESEEVLVKSQSNGVVITTEVNGPVITGLYKLTQVLLEDLPEIMEMQRLREEDDAALAEYQEAISIIDDAMTRYAENNNGTYPEFPEDLEAEGYLDYLPTMGPVPAGDYFEGGYTYHALYNEGGVPVGYFFFLYGGGEGTGFDVYTPENRESKRGSFQIGRDGIPDGVASFCYDGTALSQGEEYFR